MRVAIFANIFPDVSETFILDHITGLIDCGVDVDIFARISPSNEPRHPRVDEYGLLERTKYLDTAPPTTTRLGRYAGYLKAVYRCFSRRPMQTLKAVNFIRYGRGSVDLLNTLDVLPGQTSTYDIVHAHFGPIGIIAQRLIELGAFGEARLITSFHGYDATKYVKRYGARKYVRLFLSGDLFFANSEQRKRRLIELGCTASKILVVPMAVDIPPESAIVKERPLSTDGVQILSIARLVPVKGIEYGLRAVAQVKLVHPNLRYSIIGDGPLRKELDNLVRALGLERNVTFLGARATPEVSAALANADIFISPSVTPPEGGTEAMIVANMEAMARGIPVVSSQHGAIPELVEHGRSGLLCPERDVRCLAQALLSLIASPDLRQKMGQAARAQVIKKYDRRQLNKRVMEIYEALLARTTPKSACDI